MRYHRKEWKDGSRETCTEVPASHRYQMRTLGVGRSLPTVICLSLYQEVDPSPERDIVAKGYLSLQCFRYDLIHQ